MDNDDNHDDNDDDVKNLHHNDRGDRGSSSSSSSNHNNDDGDDDRTTKTKSTSNDNSGSKAEILRPLGSETSRDPSVPERELVTIGERLWNSASVTSGNYIFSKKIPEVSREVIRTLALKHHAQILNVFLLSRPLVTSWLLLILDAIKTLNRSAFYDRFASPCSLLFYGLGFFPVDSASCWSNSRLL